MRPPRLGIVSTFDIIAMANRYRNFFGIEFLFRLGDIYLPFSTRTTGVFVPAAGLLLGIRRRRALIRAALPAHSSSSGLTVPLAASILVEEGAIRRSTAMLTFGALLAASARCGSIGSRAFRYSGRSPWLGAARPWSSVVGCTSRTRSRAGSDERVPATRVTVIGGARPAMAMLASRMKHGRLLVLIANVMVDRHPIRIGRPRLSRRIRCGWRRGYRATSGAVTRVIEASAEHPGVPIYFTRTLRMQGDLDLNCYRLIGVSTRRSLAANISIPQATFLQPDDSLDSVPKGSLVLGNIEDPHVKALLDAG